MKFFNKKIISGAIALVTLFSFILPALATQTENARSVTLGFTDIEAREVKNITYQIVGVTLSGEDDSFDINSTGVYVKFDSEQYQIARIVAGEIPAYTEEDDFGETQSYEIALNPYSLDDANQDGYLGIIYTDTSYHNHTISNGQTIATLWFAPTENTTADLALSFKIDGQTNRVGYLNDKQQEYYNVNDDASIPTEAATNTPTPTEAATNTPTPTEAATNTPTPTETPTDTTPTPTEAPTDTTPTPTEAATNTPTPTETPTDTTPTPTEVPTDTTPTPTEAATNTPTPTEVPTPTDTMPTPVAPDTAPGGCYVATAVYGSYNNPQVWTLRRFRDNALAKTWQGRLFIRAYYTVSPTAVKLFGDTEWFNNLWRGQLDNFVAGLQAQGYASTPYQDIAW